MFVPFQMEPQIELDADELKQKYDAMKGEVSKYPLSTVIFPAKSQNLH